MCPSIWFVDEGWVWSLFPEIDVCAEGCQKERKLTGAVEGGPSSVLKDFVGAQSFPSALKATKGYQGRGFA